MKTRREFIKISALSAGGLMAAGASYGAYKWVDEKIASSDSEMELHRTPTYCEVCFWKCAGWVYKNEEGKIWKIIGNDEDPHCNGRFCPRGTGGVGMYYDEDRLKTPLIRTGERGNQTFREASWDEAFTYIAEKLKIIAEKYGPESVALLAHGSPTYYFKHLLKAYGSDTIAAPSFAQCRGAREVAFISTFGAGIFSPEPTDIRDTKCMVLIGSHIGENMHNGQVQEMSDAIDKGATIITVDPRFSTAASKSKYWLPIKPSTDIALLLAWTHEIIYNEWYDKEYVEKYTYGFEELKAHVKDFTPEWAYGITTIKPDIIRKTAKEMANAAPSVIVHPGRHVAWYGDDTQRVRTVAILNALLGSWGRRGGFYIPASIEVPDFPHPEYPKPKKTWQDFNPEKYNLAYTPLMSGVCYASVPTIESKNTYKAWIVAGTNLMSSLPDQRKTLEAIQNLDLIVVIDTMPVEITGYADVVLPECTYLERYELLRSNPHREPNIALRAPAAKPLYNSKPAWWIAKGLGEKMGLGNYFQYKDIEEVLEYQLKKLGTSLSEMKKIGVKKFPREFDDLYFKDGENIEFNTNTGKIELYSTEFENEGFPPLPIFTQHEEPPTGFYRLIYGRAPMHTFCRTANNENLVDLMKENSVWVNPKVAKEWGLKNEQYIFLENQDGIVSRTPIKVRITERIRWDSVYMVHGFGHLDKRLRTAYGRGASDTELITKVNIDPIMGATGMRGNFVTFRTSNVNAEVKI
ncbi:MAG: molybdopterin-dependent oxidoreductase [Saprospiraceae bacterium]|nr:molybdopterin-dependent oxidoreductase [Saprospiraceae bacterium]